jgi:uncharacterized membrane protein
LGLALLASSLVSVALWAASAVMNDSTDYYYFIWNLALAWVPLGLALWLESTLHVKLWSSWSALLLTLIWLLFLPNSFYVISGFVHLTELSRADLAFDVMMFASFGLNGLILGYLSLFLVHSELRRRLSALTCGLLVGTVLLLSSLAIYMGREMRWNSWDVVVNPAGLLFDVSDRLLNVQSYPELVYTTFGYFLILSSIYAVILYMVRALRQQKNL